MKVLIFAAVVVFTLCLLAPVPTQSQTLTQVLTANNLTTLLSLLQLSTLNTTLEDAKSFTLFAPTNAAIDALPEAQKSALLTNSTLLTSVLQYHVLSANYQADGFENNEYYETLADGATVLFNTYGNTNASTVNGVVISVVNLNASAGIVHIINGVLLAPTTNIAEAAAGTSSLSTLATAVDLAGLTGALSAQGPLTVFAPTDDAFQALPPTFLPVLTETANKAFLGQVLSYHVVSGAWFSAGLSEGLLLPSIDSNGNNLTITFDANVVQVNNAQVVVADLVQTNGVVHVIDTVLLPPVSLSDLNTLFNNTELNAFLVEAGLNSAIENATASLTLFAPSNDAFDALPAATRAALDNTTVLTNVLLYHVVAGEYSPVQLTNDLLLPTLASQPVRINIYGNLITANGNILSPFDATNGYFYESQGVLLAPTTTIAEVVTGNPDFSILLQAAIKADLASVLSNATASYTVFAPTNAAFIAAGINVTEVDADTLRNVLLYHVLSSTYYSVGLVAGNYPTLAGPAIAVTNSDGGVTLNGNTQVTTANLNQRNGVVHVIDKVLSPSDNPTENTNPTDITTGATTGATTGQPTNTDQDSFASTLVASSSLLLFGVAALLA